MPNYSNRAKKAWATRRAVADQQFNAHSERAKKAWATIRNRQVEANNDAFLKLSPAGKRVAIAKDVLASLQNRQLTAQSGVWASLDELRSLDVGTELQPVFKQADCTACALGACFVSAVKLGNNCKLTAEAIDSDGFSFSAPGGYDDADDTGMWKTLSKYFSTAQLALIEYAFEGGEGYYQHSADVPENKAQRAVDFYYRYEDDADRMYAIMHNIVNNNGTFKP